MLMGPHMVLGFNPCFRGSVLSKLLTSAVADYINKKVSILVFVDLALEVTAAAVAGGISVVSILVFVDLCSRSLDLDSKQFADVSGFNPCFRGSVLSKFPFSDSCA